MRQVSQRFVEGLEIKAHRDLFQETKDDRVMVAVAGPAQCGKTTLILRTMNVKPESFNQLYTVLRAKRKYGESSTSTAIVYEINANDSYAIDNKECDEQELISKLQNVRSRMERGGLERGSSAIEPIRIKLPKSAFNESERIKVTVIDTPGYGTSADEKHLNRIYTDFLPLCQIIVLVVPANKIDQLNSLNQYRVLNLWKEQPRKYRLVLTRFISMTSVDKELNGLPMDQITPDRFLKVIDREMYGTDRPDMANTCYPFEFGESWEMFHCQADRKAHIGNVFQHFINDMIHDINASATEVTKFRTLFESHYAIQKHFQATLKGMEEELVKCSKDKSELQEKHKETNSAYQAISNELESKLDKKEAHFLELKRKEEQDMYELRLIANPGDTRLGVFADNDIKDNMDKLENVINELRIHREAAVDGFQDDHYHEFDDLHPLWIERRFMNDDKFAVRVTEYVTELLDYIAASGNERLSETKSQVSRECKSIRESYNKEIKSVKSLFNKQEREITALETRQGELEESIRCYKRSFEHDIASASKLLDSFEQGAREAYLDVKKQITKNPDPNQKAIGLLRMTQIVVDYQTIMGGNHVEK
jgi:GTPase SAR1 family protein